MRAALEAESEETTPVTACDQPTVSTLLVSYLDEQRHHVSDTHHRETARILKWVTGHFAWPSPDGINSAAMAKWIEYQRAVGYKTPSGKHRPYSARQRNCWVARLKTFGNWMADHDHATANPFRKLALVNDAKQRVKIRRSITRGEFTRLVEATATQPVRNGMTGADRSRLYILAAYSGLRVSVLASLTPESFTWADGKPASVMATAKRQKSGHNHSVPLQADIGAILAPWLEGKPPGLPVFRGSDWWVMQAAKHLRTDLKAAGLEVKDGVGRVFDFHSLRGQFARFLAEAGVPLAAAQKLMDHSTPVLTANAYTLFGETGLAEQVAKLPSLEFGTKFGTAEGIFTPLSSPEKPPEVPLEDGRKPKKRLEKRQKA